MDVIALARRLAGILLMSSGMAFGQMQAPGPSTPVLPATNPTTVPATTPSTGSVTPPAQQARVEFADGKLAITADNSSLNQILREISRQTGMKVTGGVADERVFGKYGPAPAADVLADLLEGTGSNMLLQETTAKVPSELILTRREGGPTPPNPNAPPLDDESDVRPEPQPVSQPGPPFQPLGAVVANAAAGNTNPPMPPNANPTNTTPGASPNSANGAQSPQQIFEQLQRMQQQGQQQPSNPQ